MHPDRCIVRTYRWSDGLSTRPDNQNILTCQSVNTKDAPRDPLHGPITCSPDQPRPYSMLRIRLCLRLRLLLRPRASPPPSQSQRALYRCVKSPHTVVSVILHQPCHRHQKFRWAHFSTWFDSQFSVWLESIVFSIWLDSIGVSIWLDSLVFVDSIRLTSNVFIFDPSHIIRITLQSGFRESHIGQGVFEISQLWNRGIFHNSDNWNWFWREHSNKKRNKNKKSEKWKYIHTPTCLVETRSYWSKNPPRKGISVGKPLAKFRLFLSVSGTEERKNELTEGTS